MNKSDIERINEQNEVASFLSLPGRALVSSLSLHAGQPLLRNNEHSYPTTNAKP